MRTIGVVTSSRADYGIYVPVMRRIQADPDLQLCLIVTGMHLAPAFGSTVKVIEQDGFEIFARLETLLASDTPVGIAKTMGVAVQSFAELFGRWQPDILLVLGDRFEMAAAPLAALPFKIPVAHLHGGEVTEGAIDDALRHTITKLSHLHFVSTEVYGARVRQLGEEPWRVQVVGAPSLDHLQSLTLLDKTALAEKIGFPLDPPPLLVTFHPVTLEYEQTLWHITELLSALADLPLIFTLPNADTSGQIIIQQITAFVATHPQTYLVDNLGSLAYFSLMHYAAAMVGNSSSGIIEAASCQLPVVNIGKRQQGRLSGRNVIHCGHSQAEIMAALQTALDPAFKAGLADLVNPYGDGHAAERIVECLKTVTLDQQLIAKRFYDVKNI